MRKRSILPVVALMLIAVGCGTSAGYKDGVKFGYPEVANRLDGYGASTQATSLRDATVDPVTYTKASAAWYAAAPVYRRSVQGDAALSGHRKQDWLDTADLLDRLQQQEWRRQHWLFPSTQPSNR